MAYIRLPIAFLHGYFSSSEVISALVSSSTLIFCSNGVLDDLQFSIRHLVVSRALYLHNRKKQVFDADTSPEKLLYGQPPVRSQFPGSGITDQPELPISNFSVSFRLQGDSGDASSGECHQRKRVRT